MLRKPTRLSFGEGRCRLGEIATAPSGSVGVMASACMEEEIVGTREAPCGGGA